MLLCWKCLLLFLVFICFTDKGLYFLFFTEKKCRRLIIPAIVWGIVYAFALNKVVFESGWQFLVNYSMA